MRARVVDGGGEHGVQSIRHCQHGDLGQTEHICPYSKQFLSEPRYNPDAC